MDAGGRHRNEFRGSTCWRRKAVPGLIPTFPRHQFCDFTALNYNGERGNLSAAKERRNWNSGPGTTGGITQALCRGMKLNPSNKLMFRDYTMVDPEASLTVMELSSRFDKNLSAMRYSGVTWDAFGCVTGGAGGRRLHSNVTNEIHNNLVQFVQSQVYKVPGFLYRPPATPAADNNRPVLPVDKFKHVVPTEDKFLPFKQEVLDKWNALEAVIKEFKGLTKVHNDKHNPSHQPWRPHKRPAEQTPEMDDEQTALSASSLEQPPGTPTIK